MRGGNRWLLLVFDAVGVSAALLVLPCALVDLAFGTDVVRSFYRARCSPWRALWL